MFRRLSIRSRVPSIFVAVCVALAVPAMTVGSAHGAAAPADVTNCQPQGSVSLAGGEYTLQNNEWNSSAPQCVTATSGTAWTVSTANFNLSGGAPATYPSIYKGCHWGACTTNSGLPIQVGNLGSATSSWSTTQPGSGAYDVAYDLWTNSAPTTGGQPDDSEIMIWINSRGGVGPFGSKVGTVSASGLNWDVYTGRQTSWNIVSYVLQGGSTSVTNLDVKALINDSVQRGVTGANSYLIDAEAGFEIWQGGQGLGTNSFSFNATPGSGGGGGGTGPITGIGGKCVDVAGANTANGTAVQLYDCNGTGAQQWTVGTDGTIRALGKCLDVTGAGTANGTQVQLYDCNGTAAQQWAAGANNSLRNANSGRCLDATGASSANGTRLQIWDCTGSGNQQWNLPG
ncbi:ricin-type beta-trefoil lectin domain protein [Catenulispora sp. NL8]|uniref:Ricin-type beta-trefoil lectin domain protein n=1 Tax=Catenulispora pinistramenti TaxID=2705254 RepID=A0ABS5KTM3_9ACTN|nr:ricin-type beta-trefoil lectin domain protein [Catenulispora pinistramenti]MBS2549387.1 ricin-type beta-trefoil lectin domain protein [Catenulispora pinistramenti]